MIVHVFNLSTREEYDEVGEERTRSLFNLKDFVEVRAL